MGMVCQVVGQCCSNQTALNPQEQSLMSPKYGQQFYGQGQGTNGDVLNTLNSSNYLPKIIKVQALIRGFLVRQNIRNGGYGFVGGQHHRRKSQRRQSSDLNHNKYRSPSKPLATLNYENEIVKKIRDSLPNFEYGPQPKSTDPGSEQPQLVTKAFIVMDNMAKYEGQWKKGTQIRHGKGVQIWPDGSTYEGWWRDNQADGKGRLIHGNGDMYEGIWYRDKAHGRGLYQHINGAKYDGAWQEDMQHGFGVENWTDGSHYEGEYLYGQKHGKGTFTWADGNSYVGQFENNNMQGYGTYNWVDGRTYDGNWTKNQMHGKGTFTWPDGRKYQGDYVEDKKEGHGVFLWPDGRKFEGGWKNGVQEGLANYTSAKGQTRRGLWENGKRIKWVKQEDQQREDQQDTPHYESKDY